MQHYFPRIVTWFVTDRNIDDERSQCVRRVVSGLLHRSTTCRTNETNWSSIDEWRRTRVSSMHRRCCSCSCRSLFGLVWFISSGRCFQRRNEETRFVLLDLKPMTTCGDGLVHVRTSSRSRTKLTRSSSSKNSSGMNRTSTTIRGNIRPKHEIKLMRTCFYASGSCFILDDNRDSRLLFDSRFD
jgi:hypothetical protein